MRLDRPTGDEGSADISPTRSPGHPDRAHPARVALGWLALLGALALSAAGLRWAGRWPEPDRWLAPGRLATSTSMPPSASAAEALQAAATLVGWAVLTWLASCLVLAWLARLPGPVGWLAGRVAAALTPELLRRLAAVVLGAGLVATPAVAGAAAADPSGVVMVSAASLDRPVEPMASSGTRPEAASGTGSGAGEDAPVSGAGVRVKPGDSLWVIAARALGSPASPAEIATQWPRWYAANRAVIGPDPNVLHPGQWLAAPTTSTAPEETS